MIDGSKTVVSTRIRLARNIEGYPFPSHLKDEKQAREIIRLVTSGLSRVGGFFSDQYNVYNMGDISEEQAQILKENHLISPNLIKRKSFAAAIINTEESVSVMINEEDHLREQCIVKGLNLRLAYDTMTEIDSYISNTMKFAYDEQLGYLTACPTNLGTGLRASVMLFLPAITLTGLLERVIRSISKLGLTVRGIYGEGTNAEGFIYQISNEVTLGVTEEQILSSVEETVTKIIALEEKQRENLKHGPSALDIKDECLRSYGILTNAAKLSTEELLKLAANVKLGACLGYIAIEDVGEIDNLINIMSPANITAAASRQLTASERDMYRAEYVAKHIKEMIKK